MNHTANLLLNGQVLVAGGVAGSYLTSAELFEPSLGKWSVTGGMNTARERHTATLLQNGQVLAAGGNNTSNFGQTSAEVYDPSTGKCQDDHGQKTRHPTEALQCAQRAPVSAPACAIPARTFAQLPGTSNRNERT